MMKPRFKHVYRSLPSFLASTVLLLLVISVSPTHAQDKYEKYDVVVGVEGMMCPFCSYSVEKNLNKMEEVTQADVSLLDGVANLILEQDQQISKEQVTKVITDAGYKTGKFLKFPGESVAGMSESHE